MLTCRCVVSVVAWAVLAVALSGCRPDAVRSSGVGGADPPRPRPVRVVASTPMVAELVRRVGGGGVEVEVLVPVEARMSTLERTGPNESRLVAADLVVVLGFGQEAVLAPSLARAVEEGAVVCELASGLSKEKLFPRLDDPAHSDPHIWLDPGIWLEATRPIEEALASMRPVWAAELRDRAHAVRFDLGETLQSIEQLAHSGLPTDPTPVRTGQPGLRYLARLAGVGLEVVTYSGEAPSKDELEILPLDLLRAPGVKAVGMLREHDLGTVEGLRAHALDLLLRRAGQ